MNKRMAMKKWSQQPLPITRGQPLWIKGSWWKVWTINLGKKGATSQGRCECAFSKNHQCKENEEVLQKKPQNK